MKCYFHRQHNHFIDYFDDHAPDGTVIYAGDILFCYNGQEGNYTEVLGNPKGNIFLAASRDHEFLLIHRGTALHVSLASIESRKSNYIENPSFSSTANMQVSSLNPSDPLHPQTMPEKEMDRQNI